MIEAYQKQQYKKGRTAEMFFEAYCNKHAYQWMKSYQNTHFKTGSYPYPFNRFLNLVKKEKWEPATYSGFPDYFVYFNDIEQGFFVEVKCNNAKLSSENKELFAELAKCYPVFIFDMKIDFEQKQIISYDLKEFSCLIAEQ